jgi:photosystem II stability/assembly factor-like uncharacterized protein
MKHLLFYVVAVLIIISSFSPNSFAQGNWDQILPPTPTTNQMVSIYFANEDTGWAVGEHGTILKSTNSGETWQTIDIPFLTYLLDVYFPTPSIGYIVGQDGLILKTINEGESWQRLETQYTNNFNRVRFRDENIGWIIGERGLILCTEDGGLNWQQQFTNVASELHGFAFIDSMKICAVGKENIILLTEDNGLNWQIIPFTPSASEYTHFKDVFFLNETEGWIGGGFEGGIILHTVDSGATWNEIAVSSVRVEEIDGSAGSGGSGTMNNGIQQIHFFGSYWGLCLSEELTNYYASDFGNIPYFTKNGGEKWKGKINGYKYCNFNELGRFCLMTDSRLINTGYHGEFRFSEDGGRSWDYSKKRIRDIFELSIGNNGVLLALKETSNRLKLWTRSEDYGQTWHEFIPTVYDSAGNIENTVSYIGDLGINIFDSPVVFFENTKKLMTIYHLTIYENRELVYNASRLFESSDMGLTWHFLKTVNSDLRIIRGLDQKLTKFLTPDTIFNYTAFVDYSDPENKKTVVEITCSFDSGKTVITNQFPDIWNDISYLGHSDFCPIKDVHLFNGHTGIMVGKDGNILKTEDTGLSWQAINSGVVEQLWDIDFINDLVGFVVGDFGRILKTEDGGETWRKTNSGTQEDIYSISFKNDSEAWVSSDKGLRYTTDCGETWNGVPMRYNQSQIRYIDFDDYGNGYAFTLHMDGYYGNETGQSQPEGYNLLLTYKNDGSYVDTPMEAFALPSKIKLSQNYPNPFNNSTRINYELGKSGKIALKIFNLQGQLVKILTKKSQKAGDHSIIWNGKSDRGLPVATGVYIYQLQSNGLLETKKMLYLR